MLKLQVQHLENKNKMLRNTNETNANSLNIAEKYLHVIAKSHIMLSS